MATALRGHVFAVTFDRLRNGGEGEVMATQSRGHGTHNRGRSSTRSNGHFAEATSSSTSVWAMSRLGLSSFALSQLMTDGR
jgi:hypothetical protein